ncbi:hypothetical protein XELAEV_18027076mg [Xenopus laevis]|uniref:Uncharacterized protein n=1 Tax=Xenopus laevis TaxID=8355 RepID=A0A974CUV2_XENLA|nr:hypothetical protein XELAEV_18027076mg [Xenopus laevis]
MSHFYVWLSCMFFEMLHCVVFSFVSAKFVCSPCVCSPYLILFLEFPCSCLYLYWCSLQFCATCSFNLPWVTSSAATQYGERQ